MRVIFDVHILFAFYSLVHILFFHCFALCEYSFESLESWCFVFSFIVNSVFLFFVLLLLFFWSLLMICLTLHSLIYETDSIYWGHTIKVETISADMILFTALCFFECSLLTCFFSTFEGSLLNSHLLASASAHVLQVPLPALTPWLTL